MAPFNPVNVPVLISAVWLSLTILTAFLLGATSVQGWLLATMVGVIPVAVLLRLWNEGPPPTVAEVLHTTEGRR
jgi:hypothetical protein